LSIIIIIPLAAYHPFFFKFYSAASQISSPETAP